MGEDTEAKKVINLLEVIEPGSGRAGTEGPRSYVLMKDLDTQGVGREGKVEGGKFLNLTSRKGHVGSWPRIITSSSLNTFSWLPLPLGYQ